MVLFHFPPVGGVPMPRNVYNVRYLPRFGWTPVVLAPQDVGGATDVESLALVAPDTPILRARSLEPRNFRGIVSWLRRMTRSAATTSGGLGWLGNARQLGEWPVRVQPSGEPARPHAPALLWRLHRLLAFPDSQVGWLPFAVVTAIRAYRASPFDVVYSTSAQSRPTSWPGSSNASPAFRGWPSSATRGVAIPSQMRSQDVPRGFIAACRPGWNGGSFGPLIRSSS